jgi:hypothetical protein
METFKQNIFDILKEFKQNLKFKIHGSIRILPLWTFFTIN